MTVSSGDALAGDILGGCGSAETLPAESAGGVEVGGWKALVQRVLWHRSWGKTQLLAGSLCRSWNRT